MFACVGACACVRVCARACKGVVTMAIQLSTLMRFARTLLTTNSSKGTSVQQVTRWICNDDHNDNQHCDCHSSEWVQFEKLNLGSILSETQSRVFFVLVVYGCVRVSGSVHFSIRPFASEPKSEFESEFASMSTFTSRATSASKNKINYQTVHRPMLLL